MIKRILHPKQVETATVQISCDGNSGTAFFIEDQEGKSLLLTSNHTLRDGHSITLNLGQAEVEAEILERLVKHDLAILKLKDDLDEKVEGLPLKNQQIPYDEKWETHGFPVQRVNTGGARYTGTISRSSHGTSWDIDLECDQYSKVSDFGGLSGAPLVIDGYVVGVIGYDIAGTLGAISIGKALETLQKFNVTIVFEEKGSIPSSIEKDISNVIPNKDVLERVNDLVSENIELEYFLLTGNPGSGKTTIAAQIEFNNTNYVVGDRFFVKVPEEESIPTQIRATPEFFMKWVEAACYRVLYDYAPPRSQKPLNERIGLIHSGIDQLSAHYESQGKVGFFIIDGLDDINSSKIEEFLSVFPIKLPSNIKVLFSCTSKRVLPSGLQAAIDPKGEIKITPLSNQITEDYLTERLKEKKLTGTQIKALTQKSEGHPLYLRYLIKFILEIGDLPSVDDWIDSIPVIGGEIEKYYDKVWLQLNDKTDETWLAATLSRLRIAVDEGTLAGMVPSQTIHGFMSSFNKIKHLLRDDTEISIYHTSFSSFIVGKTETLGESINTHVSRYIQQHPETYFSISEKVHHLANGDLQSKKSAINECNQEWVDLCALNSVNPDVVLSDVKNVIGLAADFGIAHKVISLLLLSQRVNFRYNTLFNENTIYLVSALLALNKPQEAIRYVVRNKTLMTSDGDALYLLQRFFEYGAEEEAEILLETINQTCRNILEKGFDGASFNRYIQLKFSAVTLSSNVKFEESFHEFTHIKKVAIKIIEANKNSEETIHKFKDDVGSYNAGYYMWRFNTPPFTKIGERNGFKFDVKSSGFIALIIYQALEFRERSPKVKVEDNIAEWIEDLEYVIDKYGIHKDYHYVLLHVLIGRSKRKDLIERLYLELYPAELALDIREQNGVDLNHQAIQRFELYTECTGFLDDGNQLPQLPNNGYGANWEGNIKVYYQYLCLLHGKIKRFKVEGSDNVQALKGRMDELVNAVIPNLEKRINWNRSYALPELFFPMIYKKVVHVLLDAFPESIPDLVELITKKEFYQLGLYNEGYIDSLFAIGRKLAKKPNHNVHAFKVVKVLEEHVMHALENRYDRNEYLLRIVELYGFLKSDERAAAVFGEMIKTSMGPSWYKEAQLGIINSAVSNILPKEGSLAYLQKFAGHLHHASGEMTFQRYVKQQQEEYVGDIAKVGFLNKAIAYFKYLLLPDHKTVINNAESGLIDVPFKGQGYVLGARAIEEQAGVLDLLRNIDLKGSLVAWGLSELFMPGDDRYIQGYAIVQARILNYLEKSGDIEKLSVLFKRLSRFVVAEVSDEFRYEYLRELFNKLSDSNFERAKGYLESVGMSPTLPTKEEAKKEESTVSDRSDPLDKLVAAKDEALKNLHLENKAGARKVIVDALEAIQDQRYGVWTSGYSNKINDVRNLLSDTYFNPVEFIKDIKGLIINEPYFEEWVIADQLISLLRNIESESEKGLILDAVLEHIDLMVRTSDTFHDKYSWLNDGSSKKESGDDDKELLSFLIWFLNHPSLVVKNRTTEILTWLGNVDSETIIPALFEEMVSTGYTISKELSAAIVHQLSALRPNNFDKVLLKALAQNEVKLTSLNHFMIRDSLISSLKIVKTQFGADVDGWLTKFKNTFPVAGNDNGYIIIDEDYLEPLSDYIDELNGLGVLTKEFAQGLPRRVRGMTPLQIEELIQASHYIDRSFDNHNESVLISDFDTLLRYALNVELVPLISLKDAESVGNVLRFYQPTFPENMLAPSFNSGREAFEESVKDLFEGGDFDFNRLLLNDEIPLNYFVMTFSESRSSSNYPDIEMSGFLTKNVDIESRFPRNTFPGNSLPVDRESKPDEKVKPLFIYCDDPEVTVGSELVPAVLSNEIPDAIISGAKTVYWRVGRNWNQTHFGVPLKMGFYTTIPKHHLDEIKQNYKLIWQIRYRYDVKYIDVFMQTEIV